MTVSKPSDRRFFSVLLIYPMPAGWTMDLLWFAVFCACFISVLMSPLPPELLLQTLIGPGSVSECHLGGGWAVQRCTNMLKSVARKVG